jgi:L-ascorbate metabolism protein UlaG (beta-lactamase superfamily)
MKTNRVLGYLIRLGEASLFHSGDTVPFAQLPELLRKNSVQIAMLPVNGRSRELRENGIAGNLTLPEAIQLCAQAQIPNLIAHHFGMFEFNTIDPESIDQAAANRVAPPAIFRAQPGCCYRIMDEAGDL